MDVDVGSEQPETRYLIRQPRPLQWTERGELVRRAGGPKTSPFEIFLDLVYVAVVSNFADHLTANLSREEFVKYILILPPSWNIWAAVNELLNLWYNDDILQRIYILCNTAILVVFGNNAPLIDKDIFYLRLCIYLYLVVHANITIISLLYSLSSRRYRSQLRLWAILIAISTSFWFPLLSDKVAIRVKIALSVAGIFFELASWAFCTSPLPATLLRTKPEPAIYSIHEQERYASIYTMGLAQFIFRLILGSPVPGINFRLLLAIWTLIIAFGLNWMYVNGDGALQPRHPLTYSWPVAMQWILLHSPLLASLLAGGQVAVAGSTNLLPAGNKAQGGATSSVGQSNNGNGNGNGSNGNAFTVEHSWLLCGSLCFSVYILYAFALLAGSKEPAGTLILPKQIRLIMRPIVGIIILLLPLVHDRLSFTKTLSIIMGLIIFVVVWECVTSLQRGVRICEPWTEE